MPEEMTVEKLEALVDISLDFTRDVINEGKEVVPIVLLYDNDQPVIVTPGELDKQELAWVLRRMVKENAAIEAVVVTTDAYGMKIDQAQLHKHGISATNLGRYSTKQLEQWGVAERLEMIIATGQTRSRVCSVNQAYRRRDGAIEWLEIEKCSHSRNDPQIKFSGWMMDVFTEREEDAPLRPAGRG